MLMQFVYLGTGIGFGDKNPLFNLDFE